jgi:hypothetical protein
MVNYHRSRLIFHIESIDFEKKRKRKVNRECFVNRWRFLPSMYRRLFRTVTDAPARRLFIDAIGVHLSYDGQYRSQEFNDELPSLPPQA